MNEQYSDRQVETLPGEERGLPGVNDTGPSSAKRGLIVMAILLVLCTAAGLGYWKYKSNKAKQTQAQAPKDLQLTNAVPARTFVEPPPPTPVSPSVTDTPVVPAAAGTPPPIPTATTSAAATRREAKPAQVLDKAASSLMAGSDRSNTGSSHASGAGPGGDGAKPAEGGQTDDALSGMLSATRTPSRKAGLLGARNFLLAKGSFIDCALQTRLDSTVPGMTACVVTRKIYSDNGKVLLLESGSTITGEYRSNMKQGMARIYVLWNRIKTPNGVVINLDSPGTDPLGGAGVPGYVDTHFWERFGGAMLLSLVDDVARGITTETGNGNQQFNFNSTGDAAQNMAAEALKNTINIPPTLYKNQGEQVGVYIARDLDFSQVYDVAAK